MKDIFIFLYIQLIFLSIGFWEAYLEGKGGWAANQCGWRIKFWPRSLDAYHFWCWVIMIPMFLILPFIIFGFVWHYFWLVIASALIGTVLEDFTWFVVNPEFPLRDFNSEKVKWHKWWKFGKFEIPDFYIPFLIAGIVILCLI